MDLFEAVNIYCERLDPSFWAEPLNLFSNFSFIFAGIFLWYQEHQKTHPPCKYIRIASLLAICVGLGSAAFHSFAMRWAQLLDVGFILIYVLYCIVIYINHVLEKKWLWTVSAFLCFFIISGIMDMVFSPLSFLNNSQSYFGIMIFLGFLAFLDGKYRKERHTKLFWASVLLPISLVFRVLDPHLCPSWPFGTHFLWHLNNGLVVYFVGASLRPLYYKAT